LYRLVPNKTIYSLRLFFDIGQPILFADVRGEEGESELKAKRPLFRSKKRGRITRYYPINPSSHSNTPRPERKTMRMQAGTK
jgi:hypothetical protein